MHPKNIRSPTDMEIRAELEVGPGFTGWPRVRTEVDFADETTSNRAKNDEFTFNMRLHYFLC